MTVSDFLRGRAPWLARLIDRETLRSIRLYVHRMPRPTRIEFPGALYHVMSRGNRRAPIFFVDSDRLRWLETLSLICKRFNFVVYAYCQMTDHYHLMIETPAGNLSQGLHHLNGMYAQYVNRRHALLGHAFQGRYKAVLVQKETHLLELSRYIVLNPVRAGMTQCADEWFWSSYGATVGAIPAPPWLGTSWLLSQFGSTRSAAIAAYKNFVHEGVGQQSELLSAKQVVLGDNAFVEQYLGDTGLPNPVHLSRSQRRLFAKPLAHFAETFSRTEAMARAYQTMAFTMDEIAAHFGVSARTVQRAVKQFT
jgi:REP element-mobilizing transposase RayT